MDDLRIAVVGVGATGVVLASALLTQHPETVLVDPRPGLAEAIKENGVKVSGESGDVERCDSGAIPCQSIYKESAPEERFRSKLDIHFNENVSPPQYHGGFERNL